jgi:hypothetical protein
VLGCMKESIVKEVFGTLTSHLLYFSLCFSWLYNNKLYLFIPTQKKNKKKTYPLIIIFFLLNWILILNICISNRLKIDSKYEELNGYTWTELRRY